MGQQFNTGKPEKKGTVTEKKSGGQRWTAVGLFAAAAVLYFADIILTSAGVWAPGWHEYYVNRGLYLIVFAVPLLYSAYVYRIRGVIISIVILIALFTLRFTYTSDILPYLKSLVFTSFLMVLGLLIAHYQNIREKEQHTAELVRASEKRYRALTESLADVVWTMDMSLNYTYVNPAVTRLRGFTVEEAMKQPIEELLTPESVELARKVLSEELSVDNLSESEPFRTRVLNLVEKRKDGTTVPVEVKVIFLRDSSGKASEILGVTRELTGRK